MLKPTFKEIQQCLFLTFVTSKMIFHYEDTLGKLSTFTFQQFVIQKCQDCTYSCPNYIVARLVFSEYLGNFTYNDAVQELSSAIMALKMAMNMIYSPMELYTIEVYPARELIKKCFWIRAMHHFCNNNIFDGIDDINQSLLYQYGWKTGVLASLNSVASYENFKLLMIEFFKTVNIKFEYHDAIFNIEESISSTGFLPALAKRAESFLKVYCKKGIGITIEEAIKTILGVRVIFNSDVSWIIRFTSILYAILDLSYSISGHIKLDELLYD